MKSVNYKGRKISLDLLKPNYYFKLPVKTNSAYQNCIDSGRSKDDCQNYYKVLVQLTETDLMLCGTRSFQPMCDIRHVSHYIVTSLVIIVTSLVALVTALVAIFMAPVTIVTAPGTLVTALITMVTPPVTIVTAQVTMLTKEVQKKFFGQIISSQ